VNKGYSYLLPLLNEFCEIDGIYFKILDDVYTNIEGYDGNNIAISYELSDELKEKEQFDQYKEYLQNNYLFKDSLTYDNKILFIFAFPEEFSKEYNLYKLGKFSEFSDAAKKDILDYLTKYHDGRSVENVRRVLYKDPLLKEFLEFEIGCKIPKDSELSSIPNKQYETFKEIHNIE
jgi:hypothetical protein